MIAALRPRETQHSSAEKPPLHVDGTPHGGTPALFTVEPGSLAVLSLG